MKAQTRFFVLPFMWKCFFCIVLWHFTLPYATGITDQISDINGLNGGQSSALFLTLPTSAAILGKGQSAAAVHNNAFDLESKTAATAFLNRYSFGVTHLEWFVSTRLEYLCAALPILDIGTIGFYSKMFTLGSFLNARDIDENKSTPSFGEYQIGASFARQIIPSVWGAGISVNYMISNLDKILGQGFYINGSTVCNFAYGNVLVGIVSAGPPITYNQMPSPLPLTLFATTTYVTPRSTIKQPFLIDGTLGIKKIADQPLNVGASLQADLFGLLSVYGGYEYTMGTDFSTQGISTGAGFTYNHYSINFGYQNKSAILGGIYAISADMSLEQLAPKTAEALYKIAEQHFIKNRYDLCSKYAYKSLALDPNLWKAHALLAKIASIKRRASGNEIAILYTGNTWGNYSPHNLTKESIGGLARTAGALTQLSKTYPYAIRMNTGNNVCEASHKLKPQIIDQFYERARFDAVMLGTGEYSFGLKRYFSAALHSKNTFVTTNTSGLPSNRTLSKKIISVSNYSICFLSAINKDDISAGDENGALTPHLVALKEELRKPDVQRCNARIVTLYDSYDKICSYAGELTGVTVLVGGLMKHTISTPLMAGQIPFVSAGDSGRALGNLTLLFDNTGKVVSINNTIIPLGESIEEDTSMQSIVAETEMRIAISDAGLDTANFASKTLDGVFPFLSDRTGRVQLYLKIAGLMAEFPLTYSTTFVENPLVNSLCGKMIYLSTSPSSTIRTLNILNLNGTERAILGSQYSMSSAEFSPDGHYIYAQTANERGKGMGIYRTKASGTFFEPIIPFIGSEQKDINLSPNGALMAFSSNRDKSWQIYCASSSGERPIRITNAPADHWLPKFSSNSSRLLFLSKATSLDNCGDLWMYDMLAGRTQQITSRAFVHSYCWLSDNQTIIYSAGVNQKDLVSINLKTGVSMRVIPSDTVKNYSEITPKPIIWNNSLRYLYCRVYPDSSRKIYWVSPNGTDDSPIIFGAGNSWLQ